MTMYCMVDQTTGLSVQFVDCPPDLSQANTPKGCVAVQADGLEPGNYLLEGAELVPIGDPPSDAHVYQRGVGWVDTTTDAQRWVRIRAKRDDLLTATDWRVVRAQEQGAPLDSAWIEYRQALRDITQQPDPQNIVWPEVPAEGSQ